MRGKMKAQNVVLAVLGAILKVSAAVIVILFLYRGAQTCYKYGYDIYTKPSVAESKKQKTKDVTVTITKSMSPMEIGKLFEEKGLIEDPILFVLQYYLSEYYKEVKPGEFELNTGMTVEEMMEVMAGSIEETKK